MPVVSLRGRVLRPLSLLSLFVLVISLKGFYLEERATQPDFSSPFMDAKVHDDWAWGLASGEWRDDIQDLAADTYFRAPLYPHFLSLIYSVFGHDYYAARVVQILVGGLSALLLFQLTCSLFGRSTSWFAVILYLGYWPITYFEAELLIPVLLIPLDIGLLLLLLLAARSKRAVLWVGAGLVLGLSATARPNILLVTPLLLAWIWTRTRSEHSDPRRALIVFLVAMLIPTGIVSARNAIVGRDFVPISSQGGVNFYIGNNPQSDGARAVVPGTRTDWWGGYEDTRRIAEQASGSRLQPSAVSWYWFQRGLDFLYQEPTAALKLYLRKLALLLGNSEISNNRQLWFARQSSEVLRHLPVTFSIILSLSILGMLLSATRHDSGLNLDRMLPLCFAVPYALSILLFFITSRYRLPLAVILIPYSAYAVYSIILSLRQARWQSVLRYAALVIPIFILSSLNPLHVGANAQSRGFYELGTSYRHVDQERALSAFDASILADSLFPPAWRAKGETLFELQRFPESIKALTTACSLDSSNASAFYVLGLAYQKTGAHDLAESAYCHVLRLDPNQKGTLNNLADIYMRRGQYDAAYRFLQRALAIDPHFINAIYGLGYYYEMTGQNYEAVKIYRDLPDFPPARFRLTLIDVGN